MRSAALKGDEDCQLHATVHAKSTISVPFEDLRDTVHNGYTLFPFTGGIMLAKWGDFRQIGGEPLRLARSLIIRCNPRALSRDFLLDRFDA